MSEAAYSVDQSARRTRAEQREATRARLIEAARAAFAEHGYAGASLETIAASAGFSKGAVYSNFASKEALGIAVLETLMDSDRQVIESILERFGGVRRVSVAVAEEISNQEAEAHTVRLRLELLMQAGRDPVFREAVSRLYRARIDGYVAMGETMLARMTHKPRVNVRLIVEAIVAMGNGHALLMAGGVALSSAGHLVGEVLRTILAEAEGEAPPVAPPVAPAVSPSAG